MVVGATDTETGVDCGADEAGLVVDTTRLVGDGVAPTGDSGAADCPTLIVVMGSAEGSSVSGEPVADWVDVSSSVTPTASGTGPTVESTAPSPEHADTTSVIASAQNRNFIRDLQW